jgi:hypothetical protein
MSFRSIELMLAGVFALISLGCEPTPVVVDDDEGGTTVIESDADRDDATIPPADPGTDVNVDVGGGKGVDVDVDREGATDSNPNP